MLHITFIKLEINCTYTYIILNLKCVKIFDHEPAPLDIVLLKYPLFSVLRRSNPVNSL